MTLGQDTFSVLIPDDHYLTGPVCVVCRKWIGHKWEYRANDKLKGGWLHWRSLYGRNRRDTWVEGDVPLGQYGHYELFVDRWQRDKFADFNIFVLAVSTLSDASVNGGAGGGGAGGGAGGGSKSPQASPAGILIGTPTIQ